MIVTYLVSIGLIFLLLLLLLLGWVAVQRSCARFADRHPEPGTFRREGDGCGVCAAGRCGSGTSPSGPWQECRDRAGPP